MCSLQQGVIVSQYQQHGPNMPKYRWVSLKIGYPSILCFIIISFPLNIRWFVSEHLQDIYIYNIYIYTYIYIYMYHYSQTDPDEHPSNERFISQFAKVAGPKAAGTAWSSRNPSARTAGPRGGAGNLGLRVDPRHTWIPLDSYALFMCRCRLFF